MSTLFGIEIIPTDNFMFTEKKVTRIPGGYMNHWLIRAEITVPSRKIIHDHLNNRIYCHPAMLQEIKRHFATKYPTFESEPWRLW